MDMGFVETEELILQALGIGFVLGGMFLEIGMDNL
jgi:hypothetical protein